MKSNIDKLIKLGEDLEKKYDERVARTLEDMKECYSDQKAVKKLNKKNPLIYLVFIKRTPNLTYGLTVIYPGVIGKEYYMTKGHIHKKPSPETYLLIAGEGKLVLQSGKESKVVKLIKNDLVIVSKGYAHRVVNTSNKILRFLAIYDPDSGHDYSVSFKKRLLKK